MGLAVLDAEVKNVLHFMPKFFRQRQGVARAASWCSRLHNSFLELSYFIAVNIEAFAHTPSLVAQHPQLCILVLLSQGVAPPRVARSWDRGGAVKVVRKVAPRLFVIDLANILFEK